MDHTSQTITDINLLFEICKFKINKTFHFVNEKLAFETFDMQATNAGIHFPHFYKIEQLLILHFPTSRNHFTSFLSG